MSGPGIPILQGGEDVNTRPTYGECMAEVMRIWQNWENEGRELPAGQSIRSAL